MQVVLVVAADGSWGGSGGVEGWWKLLVLYLQCDKFSHTLYGNYAREMSLFSSAPQEFWTLRMDISWKSVLHSMMSLEWWYFEL